MKALFVIDMLNDFLTKEGALYCGESAREIIPFVKQKIERFHKNKDFVFFICDSHREDDPEFKMFPRHCVTYSKGAQIIKELPVEQHDIIIQKTRYSAFFNTELDSLLKDHAITEVSVTGVCTSICVMDTIGDLRNRDYKVIVYKEGVADFDRKAHQFSLERMENTYGAKII